MSHTDPPPTPLDAAVAEFHLAEERGEAPDRAAWLARHPDCRAELEGYFADLDAVAGRLARPADGGPPGYHLVRVLGRGGAGRVWEAVEARTGRAVALKLLADPEPEQVRRFRLEAEVVSQLEHPNIVPLYEAGEYDGRPYFTMRLIAGGTLADRLDRFRDDPRRAAELLAATARAVHFAHQRGVLHRDLKPSNVLLDTSADPAVPLVADFGLARPASGGVTTRPGVFGTPEYLCPEAANQQPLTTAADVWGLGATLYAVLTGRPPFVSDSPLAVLRLVCDTDPPPPSVANPRPGRPRPRLPEVPGEGSGSLVPVGRRTGRRPGQLAGRPVTARPLGRAAVAVRWVRRNPLPAALATAVLVGLSAVTGTALAYSARLADRNRDLAAALEAARAAEEQAQAARKDAQGQAAQAARMSDAAAASLRTARAAADAFHDLAVKNPEFLRPAAAPLRLLLLRGLAAHYEAVLRGQPAGPDELVWLINTNARVGDVYNQLGDLGRAVPHYRAAADLARQAARARPDDPATAHLLAVHLYRLGEVLPPREPEAAAALAEARDRAAALSDAAPGSPDFLRTRVTATLLLARAYREQGRREEARRTADEGTDLATRLAALSPDPWDRVHTAHALCESGRVATRFHDPARARSLLAEAAAVYDAVGAGEPGRPLPDRNQVAVVHSYLGAVQSALRDFPAAARSFREALQRRARLAEEVANSPDLALGVPTIRVQLAQALRAGGDEAGYHREMAQFAADLAAVPDAGGNPELRRSLQFQAGLYEADRLQAAGRYCEAALACEAALGFAPPGYVPRVRTLQALCLARLGAYEAAALGARETGRRADVAPDTRYDLACALSLAAGAARADTALTPDVRITLADEYAAEAVVALRRAVAEGFRDHALASTDTDLNPIRDRADFRAALAALKPKP